MVGVRWWIGSDSVYANAFEKQQDCLLENSKLHCHITTNCGTRGWACVCVWYVGFKKNQCPVFCVLALCSGSEDAVGPSRPVSMAGSRCIVCGLMFSPTSPAETALKLFISAGKAAVSNSSGYLFGLLYMVLAALCSLNCGPMCAWPHASWLRSTRLLWARIYYETG